MLTKELFEVALAIMEVAACYGIEDEEAFALYEECNGDIEEYTNRAEEEYC